MAGRKPLTSRRRALAGCLASASLLALAAPPIGWWPLAFVCLAPVLGVLEGRRIAPRALIGAVTGSLAALLTVVQPLGIALARYFEAPLVAGVLAATLVGILFGGGGFAVFAALAGDPNARGPISGSLCAAAAWVLGDAFRSAILTGLPWLLLGHLLAPVPPLAQLAAWGGVPGLSFWVACGSGAALALARPGRRAAGLLLASGLALLAFVAWLDTPARDGPGSVLPARGERAAPGAQRVALVQPSVDPEWRSDPARASAIAARLAELTARAGPVDLVVWPENALPVLLPANAHLVRGALDALPSRPRWLLLGGPRSGRDRPGVVFNSALLFDGAGRSLAHHDKVHLVPFAEYLPAPFAGLELGRAQLSPGTRSRTLALDEGISLGPLICYEMLFAEIARDLVDQGAGILVNLSNDGWFGGTAGAEQHLSAAVLRAIELRRPLLRATSDGITVAVDAAGRVVARLPSEEPGALVMDVVPARARSVGERVGAWMPLAALVVLVAFSVRKSKVG